MANALRATEWGLKKKTKPQAEVQSSSMISMDDGQPARDRSYVNAVLQTAAATGISAPPLLTRWILDPKMVTTLDIPEPLEETDQEIELLLQSAQGDWSGPRQTERASQTDQAKDAPRPLPTPESTPDQTTQPEPKLEPEVVEMPRG